MIYLKRGSDKMFSITDFDEICEYAHMWNWAPDWHMVKQIYSAVGSRRQEKQYKGWVKAC